MKRKKLLTFSLAMVLAFSLMACGTDSKETNKGKDSISTEDGKPGQSDVWDENAEDNTGDDTAQEPVETARVEKPADITVSDISEMSYEDKIAWTAYLMDAYIHMDFDVMKNYTKQPLELSEEWQALTEIPENRAFLEKTVGQMVYIPEYDIVLAKDPRYLYAKAYTDTYTDTSKIPLLRSGSMYENVRGYWSDITLDYANEIYDKYWDEAPYIIVRLVASDQLRIEDGKLKVYYNMHYNGVTDNFELGTNFNYILETRSYELSYGAVLLGVNTSLDEIYEVNENYDRYGDLVPEDFATGENFLAKYVKMVGEGDANATSVYKYYFNNAPDDNNYNAYINAFADGTVKMVCGGQFINVYILMEQGRSQYRNDLDNYKSYALLGDDFYALCDSLSIKPYMRTYYGKFDVGSLLGLEGDNISWYLERQGLMTKYEE